MKVAHYFIDRPVFASVISIVTIVVGALSIFTLPVGQYPEIAPPTVTITTNFPGAGAKVVADTVATPIELQINGGREHAVHVEPVYERRRLQPDHHVQAGHESRHCASSSAESCFHRRADPARGSSPAGACRQEGLAGPDAVGHALFAGQSLRRAIYLSNYATLQIKDELARLPGVGDLRVFGARDYSMRIWLDPQKLASREMTASDVVTAIREQNIQVAAGVVGGPPLAKGTVDYQYSVKAQGRLVDPDHSPTSLSRQAAMAASHACATSRVLSWARPIIVLGRF